MGRINKYSPEIKVMIIEDYLSGKKSCNQLASEYEVIPNTIRNWVIQYQNLGKDSFNEKRRNSSYSKEFKEQVVQDYLDQVDSLVGLSLRYRIPSHETLRKWIIDYNSHIELKDYDPKGEVYMITQRKPSIDERLEIVEYCISHNKNYKSTAELYNVAYSQVYQWVKKYEFKGRDGLIDERGRRKPKENFSEIEKLNQKIERLEKQLELKENETILLKKVKEFEGRRYSAKLDKKRNT